MDNEDHVNNNFKLPCKEETTGVNQRNRLSLKKPKKIWGTFQ